jgi:hypothetical protein
LFEREEGSLSFIERVLQRLFSEVGEEEGGK